MQTSVVDEMDTLQETGSVIFDKLISDDSHLGFGTRCSSSNKNARADDAVDLFEDFGHENKKKSTDSMGQKDETRSAVDRSSNVQSKRQLALSSDTSIDNVVDLEEALLRAHEADHNGGKYVKHNVTCVAENLTTSNVSVARSDESTSRLERNGSDSSTVVTSIVDTDATAMQSADQNCQRIDDDTESDDSVICLDNDNDDIGSNSVKLRDKCPAEDRGVSLQKSGSRVPFKPAAIPNFATLYGVLSSKPSLPSVTPSLGRVFSKAIPMLSATRQVSDAKIMATSSAAEHLRITLPQRENHKLPTLACGTEPRPVAQMLSGIGLQLVSRWTNRRLMRRQKRRERGKMSAVVEDVSCAETDPQLIFHPTILKCSCGFAAESTNVLELHYEAGRESGGLHHCCLCEDYSARYVSQFLRHMDVEHDRKVRVPQKPSTYLCQLCTFESNGRAIYEKHIRQCQRVFVQRTNQSPCATDCDIPIEKTVEYKTKAGICPVVSQPEKALPLTRTDSGICNLPVVSNEKNLVQIGKKLFVVVPKQSENVSLAASVNPKSGNHLSVINIKKLPDANKSDGPSTQFVQLSGSSWSKSSYSARGMLATSVLPLSNKSIASDSAWNSRLAAVAANAAKAVMCQPVTSQVSSVEKPAMLVNRLLLPANPVVSRAVVSQPVVSPPVVSQPAVSQQSQSSTVAKLLLLKRSVDQRKSGAVTTSAVTRATAAITKSTSSNNTNAISTKGSLQDIEIKITSSSAAPVVASVKSSSSSTASFRSPTSSTNSLRSSVSSNKADQPDSFVICPVCSGFVKDLQSLRTHMKVTHGQDDESLPRLLRCARSVKANRLKTKDAVRKRKVESNSKSSDIVCPRCDESGISDIVAHIRRKHNVSLLSMHRNRFCFICQLQFESTSLFQTHMLTSHKDLFPGAATLRSRTFSSALQAACKVCDKKDIFNLVKHMESRHSLTLGDMLKLLFCYFCSSGLQNATEFEDHMLQQHTELFPSRDFLWDEVFAHQKSSDASDFGDGFCGTYKCSLCDDVFVSASYRFRHQVICHPPSAFPCSVCSETFTAENELAQHMKVSHTRTCSIPLERLGKGSDDKHNASSDSSSKCDTLSSSGSDSTSSVDLCNSPVTVVITDEEDEGNEEPPPKRQRLCTDKPDDAEKNIPLEDIEEVLEIDGETIIIVQESDCV